MLIATIPPNTSPAPPAVEATKRQLLTKDGHRRLGYRAKFFGLLGVLLAVLLGVSHHIFGPMRHARLGLIDDHEILRFLERGRVVSLTDVPRLLMDDTEVGQWGHGSRLRPMYYLFRIIEAAVHGDDAAAWYLSRMTLVALTAFGIAALVLRVLLKGQAHRFLVSVSFAGATLAGIFVMAMPSWQDIATRLGPSEIYVGIGLALFAIGSYEVWCVPQRAFGWVFLFAGCMITAGSKEDGLFLLLPFLLIYLLRFSHSQHRPLVGTLGMLTMVFGGYIALGVMLGTSSTGGDVYGKGMALGPFLHVLVRDPYAYAVLLCFAVTLVCDVLLGREESVAEATSRIGAVRSAFERRPRATACLVAMYLVVGEAFFYQSYITGGDFDPLRYAFVTQLATLLACLIALVGLVQLGFGGAGPRLWIAVGAVLVVIMPPAGSQVVLAATKYRANAVATADRSVAKFNQILVGARDTRLGPTAQVVLLVTAPTDYEDVFALPRFLAFYGRQGPVYLKVNISPQPDPLLSQLAEELEVMATKGKLTSGWRITPYSRLHPSTPTICFYFGRSRVNLEGCTSSHKIG